MNIGTGKRSPAILRAILDGQIPTVPPAIGFDWPDAPPLTLASEGDSGMAGLLFTGRYPLAVACGWHCDHMRDSRGQGMEGFPDWIITREVVIFVELKRERDRLRPEQVAYAARLMRAGAWYELWRPSDWERIGAILRTGQRPLVDSRD